MIDISKSYIDTTNNPEERVKVQLILFTLGYTWSLTKKEVTIKNDCHRYIYLTDNFQILHDSTKVIFKPYCNYKEISLEEIYEL